MAFLDVEDGLNSQSNRGRKIALCIAKWNQPTSVLTWAWLRQYFLRQDKDELYIIHSDRDDRDENDDRWKQGGPVAPDLQTALQDYTHHIIILQGSLRSNISSGVIEKYNIDIVVLGEDFPREGGFSLTSVSQWVKANITTPFIIIRAGAVRNERLRLSGSAPLSSPNSKSLSPDSAPGRKVAIAYPSFHVGRGLIEIFKQMALLPNDEIYVVHCFPTEKAMMRHTKTILKTISMGLPGTMPPREEPSAEELVTEDNSIDFGAKELAGYNVQLNVVLKGDPRYSLVSFCVSEGIELLVLSTRTGGRLRKTLSGGSVSGFVMDKAPCPCLIIPNKALGVVDDEPLSPVIDDVAEEGPEWEDVAVGGGSPGSLVTMLRAQLEEKDKLIEALLDEIALLKSR